MISAEYDVERRYRNRAWAYDAFRPAYPESVFTCLRNKTGLPDGAVAAELGSGTGIFTRQLLDHGWTVFAVEPNPVMRAISLANLGQHRHFTPVDGHAEASRLMPQSCDLVVAAQSFHWFDMDQTLKEILRILRPEGYVAIVWNDMLRAVDTFHTKLHSIVTRCPDYQRFALDSMDNFAERVRLLFANYFLVVDQSFNFLQKLDREMLLGRMSSSSYWPEDGSPDSRRLSAELDELFNECADSGHVSLHYQTRLIIVRLIAPSFSSIYPLGRTNGVMLF